MAQSSTGGAVSGIVEDATGARVAGASVLLTDIGTGEQRAGDTDARGEFRLNGLAAGDWRCEIAARGFVTLEVTVTVEIDRAADLRALTLAVAAAPQRVVVEANTLLDSQTTDSGAIIRPEEIDNLPVNQRRWENFALLTPTAVLDPETNEVSLHAAPSTQNVEALNGADETEEFAPGDNTRSRLDAVVSQGAVHEFHVLTAGYDALHGRAAGGIIDTVTRSGSDAVHGEALFLLRDSNWSNTHPLAQLYLPAPDGTLVQQNSLPRDLQQQGSLRVGGPVLRDRLFWHATYDREHRSFPALATVSDEPGLFFSQALPGDITGFEPQGANCAQLIYANGIGGANAALLGTGSQTSAALYGTQGACFLNLFDSIDYPNYASAAAAYDNGLAYLYSLTGQTPRRRDVTLLTPQMDWQVGLHTRVSAVYNRVRSDSLAGAESQPFVTRSVSSLGNDALRDDRGSVEADSAFGAGWLNILRAGYLHTLDSETSQNPLPQEPLTALNGTASPGVAIGRQFLFGTPEGLERGKYPEESRGQLDETVAYTHNALTVRAGADWQHVQDDVQQLYGGAGEFHYTNVQDFLIDQATISAVPSQRCGPLGGAQHTCYSRFVQGFGAPGAAFTVNEWAAFADVQWRVRPSFMVTAGLRYDYERLPPVLYPNPLLPATQSFASDGNNFGPRAGFAWQAASNTVLRGAAGIYYGRAPVLALYHALLNTGATGSQSIYTVTNSATAVQYPSVLAAAPSVTDTAPDVTVLGPRFQEPQVDLFNVEAQQAIASNTVLTVGGIMALGRCLPIVTDTNLNTPSSTVTYQFAGGALNGQQWTVPVYSGARPNANFGAIHTIESAANSMYSAFTAKLERRDPRLTLRAAYTWSHALDDGQRSQVSGLGTQVLSPDDFALQHGTSALDRRQHLAAAAVWMPRYATDIPAARALLNGWLAAPVLQISSGAPYSARMLGDPPGGSPDYRTSYGYLGAGGDDFLPPLGRDHFSAPYTEVLDLRLARSFTIRERVKIEVLGDAYNLFNHGNAYGTGGRSAVDDVAYEIGSGQTPGQPVIATANPAFGTVVEQAAQPFFTQRRLQLGARVTF